MAEKESKQELEASLLALAAKLPEDKVAKLKAKFEKERQCPVCDCFFIPPEHRPNLLTCSDCPEIYEVQTADGEITTEEPMKGKKLYSKFCKYCAKEFTTTGPNTKLCNKCKDLGVTNKILKKMKNRPKPMSENS